MKITKTQLKQIIKEELESIQEMDSIPTSALMQKALRYNEISSLSDLIHLKPEHDALIMQLNDKSQSIKPSMGNIVALSLAIANLKVNNSEAAEKFLRKR